MKIIKIKAEIHIEDIMPEIQRNKDTLETYVHILSAMNSTSRLTGERDPSKIWNEHLLDCGFSLPLIPEIGSAVDVGTGGGLPGMLWAICRPHLNVYLLDSVHKKCAAVGEMIRNLGLKNAFVVCDRAEIFAAENRERFSAAAARAVGHLGLCAEYMSPLVMKGGILLCFKGPKVEEELKEVGPSWNKLGLSEPEIYSYRLGEKNLFLVVWKKEEYCPKSFPRKPGRAQKLHWWRCVR